MSKPDKLDSIVFISVPENFVKEINGLKIDSSIKLPLQLLKKSKKIKPEDITIEAIVSGMLVVIAYDKTNKNFEYYRQFVLAAQPDCIEELNTAAMAKVQQKDLEFAHQLFLTIYNLYPNSISCINLATLYSSLSVEAGKEKDEMKSDYYLDKALHTLKEGLENFGENEHILSELGAFHLYLGNSEEAEDFIKRYLAIAESGAKKEQFKKILKDIERQNQSDTQIKAAYDFMMMGDPDKSLNEIEPFIKANPKIWHGHFIKGWALRNKAEYLKAEEEFLECLKLGEKNSDIYSELAICSLEKGEADLAKNYLEIALDLDEDNFTILSNLAYLHLRDKEFDEAKKYLELARVIGEEDPQIQAMMAEYTELTGEEFRDKIQMKLVRDDEKLKDDNEDGYEEELEALEEDENYIHENIEDHVHIHDENCSCGHDHSDEEE